MIEASLLKVPSHESHGTLLVIVNISSANGLVPSGNKPLPEPKLTQFSVAIWRHQASMSLRNHKTFCRKMSPYLEILKFGLNIVWSLRILTPRCIYTWRTPEKSFMWGCTLVGDVFTVITSSTNIVLEIRWRLPISNLISNTNYVIGWGVLFLSAKIRHHENSSEDPSKCSETRPWF